MPALEYGPVVLNCKSSRTSGQRPAWVHGTQEDQHISYSCVAPVELTMVEEVFSVHYMHTPLPKDKNAPSLQLHVTHLPVFPHVGTTLVVGVNLLVSWSSQLNRKVIPSRAFISYRAESGTLRK